MIAREANFDGLIGPTHNYGGLSNGNLASANHAGLISHPREAALQGLEKMKSLHEAGLWQGILPPHQRPSLPHLRALGFSGSDREIYQAAWTQSPHLAKNLMSASSMWAANAATVSPSVDCADGRLHLTPANLGTMFHRSIEAEQTGIALQKTFPFATIHKPLLPQTLLYDEGAANHVRLCSRRRDPGVEIFVYGRDGSEPSQMNFPARQSREAFEAISRLHHLNPARTVFVKQSDAAINAGAFHNDVVCVGALNTLFYHEHAFQDTQAMQAAVRKAAQGLFDPVFIEVPNKDVPLKEAISSYLFNSMLVQFPQQDYLTLISPTETKETKSTALYCERLAHSNGSIKDVKYVDVRQSMRNGGGPACLRLRVTLTQEEWRQVNPAQTFSAEIYKQLKQWINTYYRETLSPADLPDPCLMEESFAALDRLSALLNLGSDFYPFQGKNA